MINTIYWFIHKACQTLYFSYPLRIIRTHRPNDHHGNVKSDDILTWHCDCANLDVKTKINNATIFEGRLPAQLPFFWSTFDQERFIHCASHYEAKSFWIHIVSANNVLLTQTLTYVHTYENLSISVSKKINSVAYYLFSLTQDKKGIILQNSLKGNIIWRNVVIAVLRWMNFTLCNTFLWRPYNLTILTRIHKFPTITSGYL